MSWINQGRQQHGWFGHGTASATAVSARDLRERAFAIAHHAREGSPFSLERTTDILRGLAPMMAPASDLAPEKFRQRFFNDRFDPVDAWHIQQIMRDVAHADDHDGLKEAGHALAKTIAVYGDKEWPAMLGRAVAALQWPKQADPDADTSGVQQARMTLPGLSPFALPVPPSVVPGTQENERDFAKPGMELTRKLGEAGRSLGDALGNILHIKPSPEGEGYDGADKPPIGSKPIDQTPWSGDHQKIKKEIDADAGDDTRISPNGDVWSQHPDGSWNNYGPASNLTGSGRASGRRGKDRR